MACFLVPAAEAVVVTVAAKIVKSKELKKKSESSLSLESAGVKSNSPLSAKTPFYKKLNWLMCMLWGGCALLCFEHIWHGEVVPWFPFLTDALNPLDRAQMFIEMGTVGVAMALAVTIAWGVVVIVSNVLEKRALKEEEITE